MAVANLRDGGAFRGSCADRVGDAELGRVLVLSGAGHDDLNAVVGRICLERRGRGPDELASVGQILGQAPDGKDIGGGTAEKDDGDAAGGGGLRDHD